MKKNSESNNYLSFSLKKKKFKSTTIELFEKNLFRKKQQNRILTENNNKNFKINKGLLKFLYTTKNTQIKKLQDSSKNITSNETNFSTIYEKDISHTFYNSSKSTFSSPIKNLPIKIIMKKNCIEKVIERNKMDSHKNKNFDEISKEINKNNTKYSLSFSSRKILNNNSFSIKEKIPSFKLNYSILSLGKKRNYTENFTQNKISNIIYQKSKLPLINEKKLIKIKLKKKGEKKANRILKQIRNMICNEYEDLEIGKQTYNQNNLNRVIELIKITKYNKYEDLEEFDDINENKLKKEKNHSQEIIHSLGYPRMIKQIFKNTTINRFNNAKGLGFGIPRNGIEIKEYVSNLKYK